MQLREKTSRNNHVDRHNIVSGLIPALSAPILAPVVIPLDNSMETQKAISKITEFTRAQIMKLDRYRANAYRLYSPVVFVGHEESLKKRADTLEKTVKNVVPARAVVFLSCYSSEIIESTNKRIITFDGPVEAELHALLVAAIIRHMKGQNTNDVFNEFWRLADAKVQGSAGIYVLRLDDGSSSGGGSSSGDYIIAHLSMAEAVSAAISIGAAVIGIVTNVMAIKHILKFLREQEFMESLIKNSYGKYWWLYDGIQELKYWVRYGLTKVFNDVSGYFSLTISTIDKLKYAIITMIVELGRIGTIASAFYKIGSGLMKLAWDNMGFWDKLKLLAYLSIDIILTIISLGVSLLAKIVGIIRGVINLILGLYAFWHDVGDLDTTPMTLPEAFVNLI